MYTHVMYLSIYTIWKGVLCVLPCRSTIPCSGANSAPPVSVAKRQLVTKSNDSFVSNCKFGNKKRKTKPMTNPISISPLSLPSVAFDEYDTLPPKTGIYFALDATGWPLYIGQAQNLCLRWSAHERYQRLAQMRCRSIAYYLCPRADLDGLEAAWIQEFQPRCNIRGILRHGSPLTKVTLSIALSTWRAFRMACLARGISASQAVVAFMQE